MPQLLFFAAIGALAWYGYRSMIRTAEQVTERAKAEQKQRQTGAGGTLVKDPASGEYRLRKD